MWGVDAIRLSSALSAEDDLKLETLLDILKVNQICQQQVIRR